MSKFVLFHANCYDGFAAAWAAWKYFGDSAQYLAVKYNEDFPKIALKAKELYILDFSYPRVFLLELAASRKIVILDHHATAQRDLDGLCHKNIELIFDLNRSGAGIAWDYFHETKRPILIDHVEDRDLWRFKIDGSKEVHAALVSYPMNFSLWDNFDIDVLVSEGKVLCRMYDSIVEKICDNVWIKEIGGYFVPVVNTSFAWSEVCDYLIKTNPDFKFVATFTEFSDHISWSLRSKGDFDVSTIARNYGGGGHKNAAGYNILKPKVKSPVLERL